MTKPKRMTQEPWKCICTNPSFEYCHKMPEDCARYLKPNLDNARREIGTLRKHFGYEEGLTEGLRCACGGPLFNWSDSENKIRICPFCAARYIEFLKIRMGRRP